MCVARVARVLLGGGGPMNRKSVKSVIIWFEMQNFDRKQQRSFEWWWTSEVKNLLWTPKRGRSPGRNCNTMVELQSGYFVVHVIGGWWRSYGSKNKNDMVSISLSPSGVRGFIIVLDVRHCFVYVHQMIVRFQKPFLHYLKSREMTIGSQLLLIDCDWSRLERPMDSLTDMQPQDPQSNENSNQFIRFRSWIDTQIKFTSWLVFFWTGRPNPVSTLTIRSNSVWKIN